MRGLAKQLAIQFRMNGRDMNTLLIFYIVPLLFYAVMGAVFSSINPDLRQTLAATMVIYAVTMGAVLGVPPGLVNMRESGVLRAFHTSGIPGYAVLAGAGISAFLHMLLVSCIITFTAPVFFGAEVPTYFGGYAAVLGSILFCNVMLGLLIGVVAKSQAIAMMLSQLVFLPSLLLGGIMFPAEMLPPPLLMLGKIFPSTHAMRAFTSLAYGNGTSAAIPLAVVLGIGVAAAVLTVWRFRRITRVG